MRAAPDESIEFEESSTGGASRRINSSIRSPSERGSSWAMDEDVQIAVNKLRQLRDEQGMEFADIGLDSTLGTAVGGGGGAGENEELTSNVSIVPLRVISSPNLPHVWKDLVVRVMSGRNHDFISAAMLQTNSIPKRFADTD